MLRAGAMDNAEAMMKFVIKRALEDCRKDLEFCDKCYAVWKSTSADPHRHAVEQASRRWRGGRRGDSARTRRKILIFTPLLARADADVHELLAYRRPSSLADSDPVRRRRGEGGERPAPAGAADGPPRLREGVHGLHAAGPMLPGGSRGNGACASCSLLASCSSTLGLRPPPTHAAPALGSLHTTRDLSSFGKAVQRL